MTFLEALDLVKKSHDVFLSARDMFEHAYAYEDRPREELVKLKAYAEECKDKRLAARPKNNKDYPVLLFGPHDKWVSHTYKFQEAHVPPAPLLFGEWEVVSYKGITYNFEEDFNEGR